MALLVDDLRLFLEFLRILYCRCEELLESVIEGLGYETSGDVILEFYGSGTVAVSIHVVAPSAAGLQPERTGGDLPDKPELHGVPCFFVD